MTDDADDRTSEWSDDNVAEELPDFSGFELLGRGGFATVFAATHPRLGRVAIKVLTGTEDWHLDDAGRHTFRQRVDQETRAIGSLSAEPTIVTLHTSGTSASGWPFLVMELCPGGSLRDIIRRAKRTGSTSLPLEQIIEVGTSVGRALSEAHDQGILHLDVKPGNILIGRFGTFQLSDFGIAQSVHDVPSSDEELLLTPHYAPPELWRSSGRPTPASDIYSLGATLFQAATLRRPFEGTTGRALEQSVLDERPAPIGDHLPSSLAELIAACLAKDPADRPDAATVVARLRDLGVEEDDETRTFVRAPQSDAGPSAPPAGPPPPPPPPPWGPPPAPPVLPSSPSIPNADEQVSNAPPLSDPTPFAADVDQTASRGAAPEHEAVTAPTSTTDAPRVVTGVLVLAALVASLAATSVVLGWWSTDEPIVNTATPTDAELLAGIPDDLFAAAAGQTDEVGVPTAVGLDMVDEERAELSWTVDQPPQEAEYVVVAAAYGPVAPDLRAPTTQGLLAASGSIAGADERVLRLGSEDSSVQVRVDPTLVTCFAVVLVGDTTGVPAPARPCTPPAVPGEVSVEAVSDGVAEVTWADRSGNESGFWVLGFRDQNGQIEVATSARVAADLTSATLPAPSGTCFVVRSENLANTLPTDPLGQPAATVADVSSEDACL